MLENFRIDKNLEMINSLRDHKRTQCNSSATKRVEKSIIYASTLVAHTVSVQETFGGELGKVTAEIYEEIPLLVNEVLSASQFEDIKNTLLMNPNHYTDWSKYRIQRLITGHSEGTLRKYHLPAKKSIDPSLRSILRDISRDGSFVVILPLVMMDLAYVYEQGIRKLQLVLREYDRERNKSRNCSSEGDIE